MRQPRKRAPRLTARQRQQLLVCYLADGLQAARPLAESLGVSARHLSRLARNSGHFNNYQRGAGTRQANDPRWQWAIARGEVVA